MNLAQNPGFIGLLVTCIVAPLAILAILIFSPKKSSKQISSDRYTSVNRWHRRFSENVFTRRDYMRIVEMLSRLSIFNFQEVRYRAIRYYAMSMLILLGVWAGGTFVFRDLTSSLLLLLFAYLVKNKYIDSNVEKSRVALMAEFSDTLQSLRENYRRLDNIPDALAECRRGKLLQTQMEEIYNICTAVDGEDRLDEFFSKCQFRQLKTLAETCYILNNTGDVTLETGQSAFIQDIGLIKDEIDMEVRKNRLIKLEFSGLEYLPLIPIFFTGVLKNFLMSNIPGTSVLYNGLYGYISNICLTLCTLIGFYVITSINSEQYIRSNDRIYFIDQWLRKKKWFKSIVHDVTTKSGKSLLKLNQRISGCLSMKDVEYIYAEKIIFATAALIVAVMSSFIIVASARQAIYNNTQSLSLSAGATYSAEDYEKLFEWDCVQLARPSLNSDSAMLAELKGILPTATEFGRMEEVDRIKTKYEKYHGTYYRWWYMLICCGAFILCWNVPEMILKFRAYVVKTEAEEDVLQMHTIIASLMFTSLDTLATLEWLEKNSTVHQSVIRYCVHEYPSDPELALNRLKSRSTVAEFHNICDKFITTISTVSLKEAFADLITERSHLMKLREMTQDRVIKSRRRTCSPLALAPVYLLCILYAVGPIAILGIREFTNVMTQTGF